MPIYEYRCETCDHCFEYLVLCSDEEPSQCPQCGEMRVRRQLSRTCGIGGASEGCTTSSPGGFS